MSQGAASSSDHAASNRREFLIGGALLVSAVASGTLAKAVGSSPPAGSLQDRDVPVQIGPWRLAPTSNILIPEGEGAGDKVYDQVVAHHYGSASELPVMLLIAYGGAQSGSTQLHRPEVCYPSAGFRMTEHRDLVLHLPNTPPITVRSLTGVAPGRVEQIIYWSRVGDEFPTRGLNQRWSILRQTIADGAPDGALVRMSAITDDEAAGVAALGRFAAALLVSSGSALRHLLVGTA